MALPPLAIPRNRREPARGKVTGELCRGVANHGTDQLRLFRASSGWRTASIFDHAVLGVTAADAATLHVAHRMRVLAMALHERALVGQLLELRGGHEPERIRAA